LQQDPGGNEDKFFKRKLRDFVHLVTPGNNPTKSNAARIYTQKAPSEKAKHAARNSKGTGKRRKYSEQA